MASLFRKILKTGDTAKLADVTNEKAHQAAPPALAKPALDTPTKAALREGIEQKIKTELRIMAGAETLKGAADDKTARKRASQVLESSEDMLRTYHRELQHLGPASGTAGAGGPSGLESTSIAELEQKLRVEEQVKSGADNVIKAYDESGAVGSALYQNASSLSQEAEAKIEFLRIEILRRQRETPQAGEAAAQGLSGVQHLAVLEHKIKVLTRVVEGEEKLLALRKRDKASAVERARKQLKSDKQRLNLLHKGYQRVCGELTEDQIKAAQACPKRPRGLELTGRLTAQVQRGVGILKASHWSPQASTATQAGFEPRITLTIGDATAATRPWKQAYSFPEWQESLSLDMVRATECEILCYDAKDDICAVQYLPLDRFLDGKAHDLKLPLEPAGTLEVTFQFHNAMVKSSKQRQAGKNGLRRQKGLPKIRRPIGKRLIRPGYLNLGITAWARMLKRKESLHKQWMNESLTQYASGDIAEADLDDILNASSNSMLLVDEGSAPECGDADAPTAADRLNVSCRALDCSFVWPQQNQMKLQLSDFRFLSVLGRGHFGKVLLAERIGSGQLAAIKCLKKTEELIEEDMDSLATETHVFQTINASKNPFLVNLYATFQTENYLCFAMEYAPGGDMLGEIQKSTFTEDRSRFYAGCVVLGLKYLHDNDIMYRDLKMDNLLIGGDGYLKIADYGLCRDDIKMDQRTSTFCGTPEFIAPEVLLEQAYTKCVDWWGLGVLIFEMMVGEAPFPGDDEEEIFEGIVHSKVRIPAYLGVGVSSIIRKLLQKDPTERLGWGEADSLPVMKHVFFRGLDWDKLYNKELKAPYVPLLSNRRDVANFDDEFTEDEPVLTPVDTEDLEDGGCFDGFSYTEDWLGPRFCNV